MSAIGGPLIEVRAAGSSKVEENKPEHDVTLAYSTWSEIAERCGESRLWGGMHFTAAVPDGAKLCEPIGDDLFQYFSHLRDGKVPSYVPDLAVQPGEDRNCEEVVVGSDTNNAA